MNGMISTRTLTTKIALLGLLAAVGCSANTGESSGQTRSNVVGPACAAEQEDGKPDKVVCSIDTDCDSDEVCMDGKCTGLDGEAEDGDACADAEGDADEAEADDDDDEGGADKIVCSTDADCDSDEACVSGKCH
jgi:hypothetical protein